MSGQQFIGMTVFVTLKKPRHVISGTVSAIVDQNLHLTNTFNWTVNCQVYSLVVNGANIENIEIKETPPNYVPTPAFQVQPAPAPPAPQPQLQPVAVFQTIPPPPPPPIVPATVIQQQAPPPVTAPSPFIDPAILSFHKLAVSQSQSQNQSRKPSPVEALEPRPELERSPTAIPLAQPQRSATLRPESARNDTAASISSRNESRSDGHSGPRVNLPGRPELLKRTVSSTTAVPSRVGSSVLRDRIDSSATLNSPDPFSSTAPGFSSAGPSNVLSDGNQKTRTKPRGTRGRRLNRRRNEEDGNQSQSTAAGGNTNGVARKFSKFRHGTGEEEGWATENVDDFRDTEFDFQGNLDRFDKKTVFSQIRAEDTTADEDLLVTHNRLPRQRKNYAHNENVLGPRVELKPVLETLNIDGRFDAEESEATAPDHLPEGMARTRSKSRKSPQRRMRARRSARQSGSASSSDSDISELHAEDSPRVNSQEVRKRSASRRRQFEYPFHVIKSLSPCPAVTPQQMLDLEKASQKLSFPEAILIENAARGIAHIAMKPFVSRLKRNALEDLPVVAVFAGAHFDGARAVAAGRHLRARGFTVYIFTSQQPGGKETYRHLRDQLFYFNFANEGPGKVLKIWEDSTVPERPDIIIDAIVSRSKRLSDHSSKERKAIQKMIQYANTLDAPCLSVNLPSGLSGFSGKPLTDCELIHSQWVAAIDAPTVGLAKALRTENCRDIRVWLVDSGIPQLAWTRAFLKDPKEKMDIGAEWVVGIELAPDSRPHSDAEEELGA